ncbi:MAG: hypothetical protein EBR20_09585 [Bacteroidetes bacterium]|nr:hypothetical protein [Bacteroidota bacterium]
MPDAMPVGPCRYPYKDHSRARRGSYTIRILSVPTATTMLLRHHMSMISGLMMVATMALSNGFPPEITQPGTPAACSFASDAPVMDDYLSLVSGLDPWLGRSEADVKVFEFFDPNCPHCATFHPIMKQVVEEMGQHAQFYMIPFPLWRYSLAQTEALYVAAEQGKYFEMIDAQYQAQKPGGMSLDELVSIASQIGLDPDLFLERLERGQYQQMIIERRSRIADAGVRGTPSVMINGRLVASESKSRTCMNELIAEMASGNS